MLVALLISLHGLAAWERLQRSLRLVFAATPNLAHKRSAREVGVDDLSGKHQLQQ